MISPEIVPVLKPNDFVIGPYKQGDRYCLIGWRHKFFGDMWSNRNAGSLLDRCCDDAGVPNIQGDEPDTPRNRKKAAAIWSDFLERMGYTEDGPVVDL